MMNLTDFTWFYHGFSLFLSKHDIPPDFGAPYWQTIVIAFVLLCSCNVRFLQQTNREIGIFLPGDLNGDLTRPAPEKTGEAATWSDRKTETNTIYFAHGIDLNTAIRGARGACGSLRMFEGSVDHVLTMCNAACWLRLNTNQAGSICTLIIGSDPIGSLSSRTVTLYIIYIYLYPSTIELESFRHI